HTLSLHDALPISGFRSAVCEGPGPRRTREPVEGRGMGRWRPARTSIDRGAAALYTGAGKRCAHSETRMYGRRRGCGRRPAGKSAAATILEFQVRIDSDRAQSSARLDWRARVA